MKRKASMLVPIVVMIFAATAAPILFAQACPDESSVRAALGAYDSAWNRKDVDAVSSILAGDYVYFSSTGSLTTRRATLDFLSSPNYKLTLAERSEIEILSFSTRVAVVSSRWKGRGSYGKEQINDDQRCGLVFVNQGEQWKLLTEHCVQIVAK